MTASGARVTTRVAVGVSALLVVVHATNDAFSAMLAALLPTLQLRFGLSETVLAALVATLSFSSSVTQPLFGSVADRLGRRRVAAVGVMTSSALLSLVAIAPAVWMLFALLLVGGLGSAAFHPAGTGIARAVGGRRKSLVVSVFSSGGTLGLALGPLTIGALIMYDALHLSPWLMIPGVVGGAALVWWVPQQPRPAPEHRPKLIDVSLLRGPVGVLCVSGILRSIAFVTFTSAVPLWLVHERGLAAGAPVLFWTLAVFSIAAGLGGIAAGALQPRLGREVLITGSMVAALVPLATLFATAPGSPGYFASVALAGALVNAGLPIMIVAAQDLSPHAVGAASGLMMGFTWGSAGVIYVAIGALQEVVGVGPAMAVAFLMLVPAAVLARTVLKRQRAALAAAD
jgi:MFS transporter, FSR family, fosmidomycin resistance protein